jgi:hypothetical protein
MAFALQQAIGTAAAIAKLAVLLLPTGILLADAVRREDNVILWTGAAFQAGVCFLCFFARGAWRQPLGPAVITLYLIALSWLWFGDHAEDSFSHMARAVLLVVPLVFFGLQMLYDSGAPAMRQASILAGRLAYRREWPNDLEACRFLPEVKALRAALNYDATPALALLNHPRAEVRVAALASLEFRKDWRPGQAELVLQVAQRAEQAIVRTVAVAALGNLEDRKLVENLAQFLFDPSLEVRRAAVEALLWDSEHRWPWIRFTVRRILADPSFLADGPLIPRGQMLTDEAVRDLVAWSSEKGVLGTRAAQTLAAHYHVALTESSDTQLIGELKVLLASYQTPAVLRLEVGKLLQQFQELDRHVLERLLDSSNPAPLRLIACESLLSDAELDEGLRSRATHSLRELGRLPNREIALGAADVVQRRIGIDLGLGLGQALPPVQSRQAAEVVRKLLIWATQFDEEDVENSRPHRRAPVA